jgi:DNA invertase Pin-like site-specific DNA recombinase
MTAPSRHLPDVTMPGMRGEGKIDGSQRTRLAVVYIRQSTSQQVLEHQESTRRQYALAEHATQLGWARDRVLVIDDDLGKSGTSTAGRVGFQRLVSEVSLGHVGLILGLEMSRLARSCADWYQLLDLCALSGTLIGDADAIYDPALFTDRLLLGLQGTLSEAELHIMKQRMQQGLLNKARRGDLTFTVPMGYLRHASGEVLHDLDEQVQHVVRLIFRKFEELGTLNAVLRYLVDHHIQVGIRLQTGPGKGTLEWRRPHRCMLQTVLKHPIYAGAYAYGRRRLDRRRQQPGQPTSGRVLTDASTWYALLPDRVPAYISWAHYERNLAQLAANRARADTRGVAREGSALLTGVLVCGRCGCRLAVHYREATRGHTYVCNRHQVDYGEARCQTLSGACVDAYVSEQVLRALEPAALELALAAAQHVERERTDLERLWQHRLERATYEAERARRQYDAVEPENRLVVRSLERAWEEKLAARQQLEEAYHRFSTTQPRLLAEAERAAIRALAADIPALWQAPSVTAADRKEIIRQVVQRVEVAVQGNSEQVHVHITWVGGLQTDGWVLRPVARFRQLSYYGPLRAAIEAGVAAGLPLAAVADQLNAAGYRPPKRCEHFSAQIVQEFLRRLHRHPRYPVVVHNERLRHAEWWLTDLAQALDMPPVTLYAWLRRGWLTARQEEQSPRRWIIWADDAEVARLRALHQRPAGEETRRRWAASPAVEDRAYDKDGRPRNSTLPPKPLPPQTPSATQG